LKNGSASELHPCQIRGLLSGVEREDVSYCYRRLREYVGEASQVRNFRALFTSSFFAAALPNALSYKNVCIVFIDSLMYQQLS
jgi:hypothetical protein